MVRLKVGQKRPSKDNMALPALTSISIPISITRGIHFLPHDHTHTQTHISVPTLLHSFYSRGNRVPLPSAANCHSGILEPLLGRLLQSIVLVFIKGKVHSMCSEGAGRWKIIFYWEGEASEWCSTATVRTNLLKTLVWLMPMKCAFHTSCLTCSLQEPQVDT